MVAGWRTALPRREQYADGPSARSLKRTQVQLYCVAVLTTSTPPASTEVDCDGTKSGVKTPPLNGCVPTGCRRGGLLPFGEAHRSTASADPAHVGKQGSAPLSIFSSRRAFSLGGGRSTVGSRRFSGPSPTLRSRRESCFACLWLSGRRRFRMRPDLPTTASDLPVPVLSV